ncbi:RNA polymerase sigma factor [Butyrivibrio sp. INlla16]|uniref:RNA polymerase sigma factor n=1 Tax=Butyrivibrio sp. INlla16 TaxID=1520807 RepID=UPI0008815CB1|nr:sigma-70 family RNA polymerase sigma factor [Butyrivibrio sp. INlla16]SDB53020.1 Sigma-70, region 4 [Butyrivibrio sp. INlla16]
MEIDRTDEELYTKFITEDDEDAMHILFEKYCESLTFFISGIVHNADDAEEIMMDCFAAVIAGSARYKARGGAGFKTWLYAVAKNNAYLFLRKNRITERLDEDEEKAADKIDIPENVLLKDEKNKELYKALGRLSADQRMVLYLKCFEGMDTGQISQVMKKSIRQIYKLTDRGKNRLRDILTAQEFL